MGFVVIIEFRVQLCHVVYLKRDENEDVWEQTYVRTDDKSQQFPLKRRYTCTILHGVRSYKTVIFTRLRIYPMKPAVLV